MITSQDNHHASKVIVYVDCIATGFQLQATEWSALVMKMAASSTIQIQVDEIRSLVASIDGVIQEFDDVVTEIGFNGILNSIHG